MKLLIRLLGLFKPYSAWMVLGITVALFSALANITLMGTSGWFIAAMGLAGTAGTTINYFTPAAIIRACAIIRTSGRYAERLLTHEATFRLIARLRSWFYERLEPLIPAANATMQSGDLFSRLQSDINILERFYLGFLVPVSVSIISSVIVVVVLSLYDPLLALIMAAFLVSIGVIVPWIIFLTSKTHEQNLVENTALLRRQLSENLQGMGELLLYDTAKTHRQSFEQTNAQITAVQSRLGLIGALGNNSAIALSGLTLVALIIIGMQGVAQGTLAPPDLAMVALLVFAAAEVIGTMPAALQGVGSVLRAAQRIFEIVDQAPGVSDPATPAAPPKAFSLSARSLGFTYKAGQVSVLSNLSFDVKPGEKLAIIGPTGSGKSTIVNLLLRFWQPQAGQITLGGQALEAYKGEDIRRQFAVMPQRPYIFATTLRDNIMLARPKASQSDLEAACEKAGLADFIASQPDGYDTFVGENGKQLSGGQIKRLALARAFLKQAPCLILDEPGEGLDYMMEEEILSRVIDNLGDTALILITHRKSALPLMDQVLDLEAMQNQSKDA